MRLIKINTSLKDPPKIVQTNLSKGKEVGKKEDAYI